MNMQTPGPGAATVHNDDYEQLKAEVMRQRVLLLAMTQKSSELKDHLREARDRMRAQAQEQEARELELQSRIQQLERALQEKTEDTSQELTRSRLAEVMRDSLKHMEERDEARRELQMERDRRMASEARNVHGPVQHAEYDHIKRELADTKRRLDEAHASLARTGQTPTAAAPVQQKPPEMQPVQTVTLPRVTLEQQGFKLPAPPPPLVQGQPPQSSALPQAPMQQTPYNQTPRQSQPPSLYGSQYGSTVGPQAPYGAPPPQQSYGAPPPQQSYGAPPPQQSYGAPPPQSYGAPPAQYGAPQQPPYGGMVSGQMPGLPSQMPSGFGGGEPLRC